MLQILMVRVRPKNDNRRTRALLAIIIMMVSMLTSACWDKRELEDEAWVLSLGIDKADSGLIELTARTAIPRQIGKPGSEGGGGGGDGLGSTTVLASVKANTILGGIGLLNSFLSRRATFLHCSAVVFGEDLAKEGLRKYLDELASYREFRRTIFPFVSLGKAKDLLVSNKSLTEKDPAKYVNSISEMGRITGMSPHLRNLHHLIEDVVNVARDPHTMVVAVNPRGGREPSAGGGQTTGAGQKAEGESPPGQVDRSGGGEMVDFSGTAIFSGDKMVGILNGAETRALLMLSGSFRETLISIPDPVENGKWVSLRLTQGRHPKVSAKTSNRSPEVSVEIALEADLIGVQGETDYVQPEQQPVLEQACAGFVESQVRAVIEKLGSWNADPIGYGNYFRKYFPTYTEWERVDWRDIIRSGRVSTRVNVQIRRVGLQLEAPKAGMSEEEGL